jgi:hypothetical protein
MARWLRMTLALPIAVDLEVKVTLPRHMAADEWARMLELLEAMRPGIVKESADIDALLAPGKEIRFPGMRTS